MLKAVTDDWGGLLWGPDEICLKGRGRVSQESYPRHFRWLLRLCLEVKSQELSAKNEANDFCPHDFASLLSLILTSDF
jgi:hypothetical protein